MCVCVCVCMCVCVCVCVYMYIYIYIYPLQIYNLKSIDKVEYFLNYPPWTALSMEFELYMVCTFAAILAWSVAPRLIGSLLILYEYKNKYVYVRFICLLMK